MNIKIKIDELKGSLSQYGVRNKGKNMDEIFEQEKKQLKTRSLKDICDLTKKGALRRLFWGL